MNESVSIITILHNSEKWLGKFLHSLERQSHKNFELVVVDNNSQTDPSSAVKRVFPDAAYIRLFKNIGYAGGISAGVEKSSGKYILVLNPDTWLEPDFLEKIVKFFKSDKYDLVGVLEGDYFSERIKKRDFFTRIDPLGHTISLPQKNGEEQFNVCGFCLFFEKSLYEETGGMDENFFLYIEEIDWCWRLHIFGKRVGLADELLVHHAGTADGRKPVHFTFLCRNQNIPQMLLKNYSWYNLLWAVPLYLTQNIFEILFFLATGKPKLAWSYIEGWSFVTRNLPKIMRNRKWVQARRKIGDFEIMKKYFYFGNAKFHHLLDHYRK